MGRSPPPLPRDSREEVPVRLKTDTSSAARLGVPGNRTVSIPITPWPKLYTSVTRWYDAMRPSRVAMFSHSACWHMLTHSACWHMWHVWLRWRRTPTEISSYCHLAGRLNPFDPVLLHVTPSDPQWPHQLTEMTTSWPLLPVGQRSTVSTILDNFCGSYFFINCFN